MFNTMKMNSFDLICGLRRRAYSYMKRLDYQFLVKLILSRLANFQYLELSLLRVHLKNEAKWLISYSAGAVN